MYNSTIMDSYFSRYSNFSEIAAKPAHSILNKEQRTNRHWHCRFLVPILAPILPKCGHGVGRSQCKL